MRIYLDHNASAPLRPEARAAMLEALDLPGNPSSAHREGSRVRMLVERARAEVAALVGAEPAEIAFTSGATEANNLALRGVAQAGTLVTTAIEHASVLETVRAGARERHVVGVDRDGRVSTHDVVEACGSGTALVSVGLANGEVGSIAPVADIAGTLAGRGIVVHTDAAQAAGRIPIDVRRLGVDCLSLSAHKLAGPTGVGALWIRRGLALTALATGGSQERGRRAGTENVAGIVGFGVAARLARAELETTPQRVARLRDRLWAGIRAALPDVVLNGPATAPRLPNTLNVTIPGVGGESLLVLLDLEGIAASLGSACAAGSPEPSHVLRAMGRSDAEARSGLRVSLGPTTTEDDVDGVVRVLPRVVAQIRAGRAASERVVVAMSGGVDSAVAAARCVAAGYDVVGISLRLARGGEGSCCSLDDFLDARAVADTFGFPHYVFDFTDVFEEQVVAPFVADYLAGRTPNPCTRCNQHVKFDLLWRRARELGATRLATGHYARIGADPATGTPCLRAAHDAAKDQSYFLFTLGADEIQRTLFPIGDSTKAEVRAEARRLGLPVAEKPDSMEVCFVPRGDAAGFVAGRAPDALRPGAIVDGAGTVLGVHPGIHAFTVGQRRGLGVGGGPRRYVRAIDAASGTVTVAGAEAMRGRGLRATDVRWSAGTPPAAGTAVGVRIRHRHPLVAAQLTKCGASDATVAFDTDGPLVTPGQAAVFYDDDRVVGGGWIVGELAA